MHRWWKGGSLINVFSEWLIVMWEILLYVYDVWGKGGFNVRQMRKDEGFFSLVYKLKSLKINLWSDYFRYQYRSLFWF